MPGIGCLPGNSACDPFEIKNLLDRRVSNGFDLPMPKDPHKPPENIHAHHEWLTPDQLIRSAEAHVANWLEKSGYAVNRNHPEGALEIEAERGGVKILVRVKHGVYPAAPKALSKDECEKLKANAAALGRRPYAAKIAIGPDGFLIKHIEWQNVP